MVSKNRGKKITCPTGFQPPKSPLFPPMEQNPFTEHPTEFAENPEPRCASILLLDVSGSMSGAPLQQLQEGLMVYKDELFADTLARKRVEIAIVTFGGAVQVPQSFTTAEFFNPPTLVATGDTPMGAA